jgi:hypothetical protein
MIIDIQNVSEASVGMPILADQLVHLKVVKCEARPQKKDPSAMNLSFEFKVDEPELVVQETGMPIPNRNFSLFQDISLKPSIGDDGVLKYDPRVRIKELLLACGYSEDDIRTMETSGGITTDHFMGKWMRAKVVYRKPDNGFDAKNEIRGFKPCEATFAPQS